MNAILHRLERLGDDELLRLSKAIDMELNRRVGGSQDETADSVQRSAAPSRNGFVRSIGSSALPVKYTDMKGSRRRLAA
jgi:hypothetical protein